MAEDALAGIRRKQIIEAMTASLVRRRESLGIDGGGLFAFYSKKLDQGKLLSEYDMCVADWARAGKAKGYGRIWDIGAGAGQLGCLLAHEGHRVVAVERELRRFQAMQWLAAELAAAFPQHAARIELRHAVFPDTAAGEIVTDDLALLLGCTFTAPQPVYDRFTEALAPFRALIVDTSHIFNVTEDRAEWTACERRFADELGFADQTALMDQSKRRVVLMRR